MAYARVYEREISKKTGRPTRYWKAILFTMPLTEWELYPDVVFTLVSNDLEKEPIGLIVLASTAEKNLAERISDLVLEVFLKEKRIEKLFPVR